MSLTISPTLTTTNSLSHTLTDCKLDRDDDQKRHTHSIVIGNCHPVSFKKPDPHRHTLSDGVAHIKHITLADRHRDTHGHRHFEHYTIVNHFVDPDNYLFFDGFSLEEPDSNFDRDPHRKPHDNSDEKSNDNCDEHDHTKHDNDHDRHALGEPDHICIKHAYGKPNRYIDRVIDKESNHNCIGHALGKSIHFIDSVINREKPHRYFDRVVDSNPDHICIGHTLGKPNHFIDRVVDRESDRICFGHTLGKPHCYIDRVVDRNPDHISVGHPYREPNRYIDRPDGYTVIDREYDHICFRTAHGKRHGYKNAYNKLDIDCNANAPAEPHSNSICNTDAEYVRDGKSYRLLIAIPDSISNYDGNAHWHFHRQRDYHGIIYDTNADAVDVTSDEDTDSFVNSHYDCDSHTDAICEYHKVIEPDRNRDDNPNTNVFRFSDTLTKWNSVSEPVTLSIHHADPDDIANNYPDCGPWHSDDCDCDAETCVTCHATWYGANCTQQCADSHCGGHGRCDDGPAGTGKCACDDGWTGSSCAIAVPVITLLEPSGTCQPTEDVAADGSTVFRADCRHEPATITVHGRNFQLTANNVTFTDGAACAVVRTLSAQLLTCLLAEPLDPGNYTAVVAFEVGGESATSEPRTLEVSLATSTPSITLTPTLTVSDSLVPLCTAEHPWDGVPCLCDGAAEQALCGASEASSLVCTSSPANASAKTCETFPKCVPDQHLPDCLCLEAPDGALCEDGDPHTADEECNRGQCVGVPICDEGRSVTDNCTCTEAAKKTRCAAERACDGEGQCLEDLESLRVSVTKSSFSTTGLKVPVVVSFETGLLRAHDVLLVIWINASEDAVSLSEMASCGRLTAGQMAGQASTGITFTCARGNLAENYEESITIEVSPVVFGAERVPITAEVYSSDIFQAKDRHVANASVVLPVADLSVEILAEGVEDVDWKFVPRVVVCRIRNKGPAVAAGVSLSLQTEGGWVLPGGVILFNESIGSSGEVVVPLETLLPRDGNTSALYLSVRAEVSMGGVALATNERLVDPVAADNAAFVAFGPFHQPQPEPTPQRPDGLPGAPGTTPLPFAFEPASDPWLRPSQSLPAFVLYACLFVSSILTLTHFRAPALTRHQLLAHAMWNPPAHKPKGTLPPLDRIPD
eukprot:gene21110-32521_t